MSAIFRNYEHCGILYVSVINTHLLPLFLYYFVVPFTLFWTTGRGFNQYSYYYYLFSLGPEYRLWHCYCHMGVRCLETTNTTVYCMSELLIHMSYFSFIIILSFHSRCSEPRVVGLINIFIIVTYFAWGKHIVFDIIIVTRECAV